MAAPIIYATQLMSLKLGHALWEPNPGDAYDRIRIGDVGFIRDGFFNRLFNCFLPAGHEIQARFLPVPFRQLVIPSADPAEDVVVENLPLGQCPSGAVVKREPLGPGVLLSRRVSYSGGKMHISGGALSMAATVEPTAEASFECSRQQGAALILEDKAYREDLVHYFEFLRNYTIENCLSWLAFANRRLGVGINASDLFVATGVDLTCKWAMAAFLQTDSKRDIGAGVDVSGMASVRFSYQSGWTQLCSTQAHDGPSPLQPPPSDTGEFTSSQPTTYNQAIFVRGFRVKQRWEVYARAKSALRVKETGPSSTKIASVLRHLWGKFRARGRSNSSSSGHGQDAGSSDHVVPAGDMDVETIPEGGDICLLDPILDYILTACIISPKESDAELAIAHDEDMWVFIEDDFVDPQDLGSILTTRHPVILVENGIGRIANDLRKQSSSSQVSLPPSITEPISPSSLTYQGTGGAGISGSTRRGPGDGTGDENRENRSRSGLGAKGSSEAKGKGKAKDVEAASGKQTLPESPLFSRVPGLKSSKSTSPAVPHRVPHRDHPGFTPHSPIRSSPSPIPPPAADLEKLIELPEGSFPEHGSSSVDLRDEKDYDLRDHVDHFRSVRAGLVSHPSYSTSTVDTQDTREYNEALSTYVVDGSEYPEVGTSVIEKPDI
ncbi:hypothetical protein JAAARDRAFT_205420 [Jaapia argillacea MUCL 33604]|uniref:Uncharacterized protein n=1 Tax=Jaapia argillacea MUCL 33604 TaxID=933084 RepID=A0A067Q0L7_9AGAM|nr:hypothetical protein JAAARDRAFT_205420 [Jaapia argillacea MUCL 33604]